MKYSALIGNPVEHSISPQLFDLLTKKLNIDYSHIKILVENKDNLLETINLMCTLEFVGFNITCPYKIDTYNLIEDLDEEAKKIHSINSVVIKNKKAKGYNTDGKAAIRSINHFYNISASDNVVIIGAGGVAYPILYEIYKITNNVVVFNKDEKEAQIMCDLICPSINYYSLENKKVFCNMLENASIIINATSVGMYPDSNTLINEELFDIITTNQKKCYFDVVFNPWETKMIELAKRKNQIAISGGYMLIYQAILVLELWLNCEIKVSSLEIDELAKKMIEVIKERYD